MRSLCNWGTSGMLRHDISASATTLRQERGLVFLGSAAEGGVDPANTQEIPGWNRLDVGARYATKVGGRPVVVRANVENVLDDAYWHNSSLFRGAPGPS